VFKSECRFLKFLLFEVNVGYKICIRRTHVEGWLYKVILNFLDCVLTCSLPALPLACWPGGKYVLGI
jgi:hypothetical protein